MEMRHLACVLLFNFLLSTVLAQKDSCKDISNEVNLACFLECKTPFCKFSNGSSDSTIQCRDTDDGNGWCKIEMIAKEELLDCVSVGRYEDGMYEGPLNRRLSHVTMEKLSLYVLDIVDPDILAELALNQNCWKTSKGDEEICLYKDAPKLFCGVMPQQGYRQQCRITRPKFNKCIKTQLFNCSECNYFQAICAPNIKACTVDGRNIPGEEACFIEDTSDEYCHNLHNINHNCILGCAGSTFCQTSPIPNFLGYDRNVSCGEDKENMKRVNLCSMNPAPKNDFVNVYVMNRCYHPIYIDMVYNSYSHFNRELQIPLKIVGSGLGYGPMQLPADAEAARVVIYDEPSPEVHKMERSLVQFTSSKRGGVVRNMNVISYDISNVDSVFLPVGVFAKFYGRGSCGYLKCNTGNYLDMKECPEPNRRITEFGREFCLSSTHICSTDYDNYAELCNSLDSQIKDCMENVEFCNLCASVPGIQNNSTSCTTLDVLLCTGYFAGHHPEDKGCVQNRELENSDTVDCNYHGKETCAMLNRKYNEYAKFANRLCASGTSFSQDYWDKPNRMQHCMSDELNIVACPN